MSEMKSFPVAGVFSNLYLLFSCKMIARDWCSQRQVNEYSVTRTNGETSLLNGTNGIDCWANGRSLAARWLLVGCF